jgi:hypothetical protein
MKNDLQLHGGGYESRRAHDFYPTPPDVTVALMKYVKLPMGVNVWECAAGNGMMAKTLEALGYTVESTDIRTEGVYGRGGVDYLKAEPFPNNQYAIITNPPFAHSGAFIRKALNEEVSFVAMLLKSQYWHAKTRIPLFREFPPSYILPLTWRPNFDTSRGSAPTMEVQWTVWLSWTKGQETKYDLLERPTKKDMEIINEAFIV